MLIKRAWRFLLINGNMVETMNNGVNAMPFKSDKELSSKVKGTSKLSPKKKRQFRHVFNECYDKNGEDGCYQKAWGVVNRSAGELLHIAKSLLEDVE